MTPVFNPKLEHLLTYYFMAIGDQHDIQQAFIQNDILIFDMLNSMCTLQFVRNIQLIKGDNSGNALNGEN